MFVSNINIVNADPIAETTLKVGYIPNTNFIDEDWAGHYRGYGYEYMESLAIYGHWNFEYIPYRTWLELGEALQSGEVDMIPTMPGDYRAFRNTTRTDHVIGRFPMELIVSDAGLKPEMKIGNLPTSYATPALPSIAEEEGFSYELISYNTFYDMVEALNQGDIDGYIDAMVYTTIPREPIAIFDRQSYRLLVKSSNAELLDALNYAMDQMLLYQPNIRDRLNRKYMRNNGFPLILSRKERDFLQNHKKLKASILNNQKPDAYFEDGEYKGSIIDIVKKMGEDLGVEIEFVRVANQEENAKLLQSGQIDFMADALGDFSWANDYDINLTQPYINVGYVAVHRKDEQDQKELPVIACVKDLLYTKSQIEQHFTTNKIHYVSNINEAFQAVSTGQADLLFVPRSQAMHFIEDTETYNLSTSSEEYFNDTLCLGVSKNKEPELWHILNKEINHLDKDFINAAINKNQRSTFHLTPRWLIYHHPVEAVIGITMLALIIGGIIIYRQSLKREHIKVIQHMAYTDLRYNMPNLVWLESQMSTYLKNRNATKSTKNVYIAVLAMESKSALVAQYGEDLLISYMRDTSKQLEKKPWVDMVAIGISSNKLICVCQAESDAQISEYMSEILEDYSYIETKDSRIWLHMRAGICEYHPTDFSVRQVAEKANVACSASSEHDVQVFNDKMQDDMSLQHKIEGHMEKALADGEFKAWYQPKYDIKTRRIIGAEALVRWTSSEMGFMPPGKFIPLFEQNGFVIPVDYAILEQVFQLQKSRLKQGKEVVPISVNQSRLHMTEEGYLDKIKAIIDKYQLSPTGLIELEVTETVFGDFDQKTNQKRAADIISKLHEMGFTISVDDFGSGYSSFMMLNHLPMDVMKIDRTLLDASGDSNRMRSILANVIKLGRSLNMQVICEGIETREQEELLLELGCHYGQGFLNAKPMPLDDFIAFFEKRNAEVA